MSLWLTTGFQFTKLVIITIGLHQLVPYFTQPERYLHI